MRPGRDSLASLGTPERLGDLPMVPIPAGAPIFEQRLEYSSPEYAAPRYAGNISETSWSRADTARMTYVYAYDRLGRLVDGHCTTGMAPSARHYGERNITYDKNSNILSLDRYNGAIAATRYRYAYDGNRKLSVTSGTSTETAADYGYRYDIMGNISKIEAEDLLISYNYLNLSSKVTKTGTPRSGAQTYVVGVTRPTASYLYLADGTKVQAIGETGQGYEYVGSLRLSVSGNSVDIESIPFAGGRIVKTTNGYEPQYYITDHLGSTRAIVRPAALGVEIMAEYDYMPYGTQHIVAEAPTADADYKYTGKEQQGAFGMYSLYDSQARFQNVTSGCFLSQDPLSGDFPQFSPYIYCGGDPIGNVDPDGRIWRNAQGEEFTEEDLKHVKVYIFYAKCFVQQAFVQYNKAVKKYGNNAVAMSKTISEESFINDWANMNGDIEAVLIMTHGKNQSISIDNGKQITSTGEGKTNIYNDEAFNVQDLDVPAGNISNATLFMYSCHSADDKMKAHQNQGALKGCKKPIAQVFSETFNFKTVQGTKGSVNYYNWFEAFMNNFLSFGHRPHTYLLPHPANGKWVYYKKTL